MSTPVSVILIAHSNARTLSRTINSVANNSRAIDQKILVLNNPSNEVSIIASQLSNEWLVTTENENSGPQHARNKGALLAVNEFLVFLDDDIQLPALWIEHMLTKFTHPKVAIGQGHIQFEKNSAFFWNYLRYKNTVYFCKMKDREIINMCDTAAIIVRKRWFTAMKGFSKDLNIGEDSYFATKITGNGGEIFLDMKYSLTQTFDEAETFINHLNKNKKFARHYIQLYRKVRKLNYISIDQFFLKAPRGCKRPISYRVVHFILTLNLNLNMNRYREILHSGKIDLTTRKKKL